MVSRNESLTELVDAWLASKSLDELLILAAILAGPPNLHEGLARLAEAVRSTRSTAP
ncbi:MAG: hypothetical protein AAF682_01650 [Planctomycetota bacterium]